MEWTETLRRTVDCLEAHLLEEDAAEPASYGVEIELEGETAAVRDLSLCRERVQALAEKLVRGAVTPVALRDVVDDWLLE